MKQIIISCLVLFGCLAVTTEAYQVHEVPEENDETVRGKRQQNSAVVIDSIFNIPISAIKQTSQAAQTFSPQNSGTIDSVLKIPVATLQAVSTLIKNRYQQQQQQQQETTPLSRPNRGPQHRYDQISTSIPNVDPQILIYREQIKKQVEAQREQQRLYQRQLHRRRIELLQQHNRRMQQQINNDDEREQHRFYRDPYGFNALAKWIVGPRGIVFNGHAGHGDGHVYQYYNAQKPLHFGGQASQPQVNRQVAPTKPTQPIVSSTSVSSTSSTTGNSVIISSSSSQSSNIVTPAHTYAVREVIDEGTNPFTWPNWFGILRALDIRTSTYPSNDKRLASKKPTKVKFDEQPLQNKIAPKDEEYYYKNKYTKARKNYEAREEEITGNEIDGEVVNSAERDGKLLFPAN